MSTSRFTAAGIELSRSERRVIQPTRTVAGTLGYDQRRLLDLRVPLDCTVREVFAELGQWIERGQRLAILSSAQMGLATDEIARREADL